MSTIKTLRIKDTEAEQLKIWMSENKNRMVREMTQTEILHHFIYLGLCKSKIDNEGNLKCGCL
jgi:hypothetical protein